MLRIVDLDIVLAETPTGYTARAMTADGGSNAAPLALSKPELLGATRLLDVYRTDIPPASMQSEFVAALRTLQEQAPGPSALTQVGTGLYNALPQAVVALFHEMWGRIEADRSKLLRVRLHFDKAELGMLPWEYLKVGDTFLCEHPRRSLVRYPESGGILGPLDFVKPLRILIWVANPRGTAPLTLTQEIAELQQILQSDPGGRVTVDVVTCGGPGLLLDKLQEKYNVLHYVGHGGFDQKKATGVLGLEHCEGGVIWATPDQIRPGVLDNPDLKLIVLNACDTAKAEVGNQYAALALNLARFTPAVIAMQAPILDDSARVFAKAFYREFSVGTVLDICLTRARRALIAEYGDQRHDWGLPALFTRATLGRTVADRAVEPKPAVFSRIRNLVEENNLDEADRELARSLGTQQNSPEFWYWRSRIALARQNVETASAYVDEALKRDTRHPSSIALKIKVLLLRARSEDIAKAHELAQRSRGFSDVLDVWLECLSAKHVFVPAVRTNTELDAKCPFPEDE